MNTIAVWLLIAAVCFWGVYRSRRQLIARFLGLSTPQYAVRVEPNIPIPMPDGIFLFANHYAPAAEGKFPTILIRNPWGRGWQSMPFGLVYAYIVQRFAERGYHVILHDTRKKKPDELFLPDNEATDGLAAIQWITQQLWFDGNLGMWGASYLGFMQWSAASDAPPALKALMPITTTSNWAEMFYQQGALKLANIITARYLLNVSELPLYRLPGYIGRMAKVLEATFQRLPLIEMDKDFLGVLDSTHRQTLEHLDADDVFWHSINHRSSLANSSAAVHLVGGWYDIFVDQTIEDYRALKTAGKNPHLTLGAWHHTDTNLANHSLKLALDWFDIHLKNHPEKLPKYPVRLFVMGSNRWQNFTEFPPPAQRMTYYLHEDKKLALDIPTLAEAKTSYSYDPANPTPAIGGAKLAFSSKNPAGQQPQRTLESRPDVIFFTSDMLSEDTIVIGQIGVELHVTSSAACTDFVGRLCDVLPDEQSLNVCDGIVRLDHLSLDTVNRVNFTLSHTAYCFRKGHRIRLQICSAAHPHWNRHLNTCDPLSTSEKTVIARQTIYHDVAHPSVIILPVITA